MAKTVQSCVICGREIPLGRYAPGNHCSKRCQATEKGYGASYEKRLAALASKIAASTAWRPHALQEVVHIVTGAPVLVLSDIHAPIHSEKWLRQAVVCGKLAGAKTCLINGDFIDANQISRHIGSYYRRRSELNDDLEAADAILKVVCGEFDQVHMLCGNHDMRLIHRFGGEVSVQRAFKIFGSHENFKVTERSFIDVNDIVRAVHPRQYSKIRGKLPADLSQRWQKSIITGHQHHSAMTISPCGKFQSCDVGCIADTEIQDYIRNECTTHVEPLNGFAIIYGNKIQCFDKFTPWHLYGFPDIEAKK